MSGPRARIEAERSDALASLARLTRDYDGVVAASRDSNADDEHDPEGATIAFERSQIGALRREAEQHLAEAQAALERLDAGTYGTCEQCGRVIAEGRLEVRPTARLCIDCASAAGRRR